MNKIAEIREKLEKITPGQWEVTDLGVLHITSGYRYENGKHIANWIAEIDSDEDNKYMELDAEFIAAAPEYISFLLGEVERLTQALDEIVNFKKGDALTYVQMIKKIAKRGLRGE